MTEIQLMLLSECMTASRDPSAASARTADVMRTNVRSELESGRCQHGDPNDGSGPDAVLSRGQTATPKAAVQCSAQGAAHRRPQCPGLRHILKGCMHHHDL